MFFVKQRTAYEMHISDWSSDVCSSDLSDSRGPTIDCYVFDPSTGALSGRRRFATLDEATGRPDGGACDGESHYWSAGVSAGALNRFAPDGPLVSRHPVPEIGRASCRERVCHYV